MATLEEITSTMAGAVGADSGLGKKLKFDFGADGKIFIDGASSPNTVSNADDAADCTIKVAKDDFEKMAAGQLDPTMAFMQGKLKVEGDMSIAMKLGPILQKAR
jgi:putative sterol carrier protein